MIQLTHTSTQCNEQQSFSTKNLYFPKNKDGQRAEQIKGGMRVNMTEGVKQKERRRTGGDRIKRSGVCLTLQSRFQK